MREYKLPYPNRVLSQFAVFIVAMVVVVILVYYKYYRDTGTNIIIEDPFGTLAPFFIIAIIAAIIFFIRYRKYSKLFVLLRIDENSVSTYAEGMFDVTITKQEVTSIKELPNGDLIIEKEGARFGIPNNLPQFEETKEMLATWKTFTPASSARRKFTIQNTVPALLFFTSYIAGFKFTEAPWSWLLLAICLASGLYIFWVYHKFKENFASRARERWAYLAIMALAIFRAIWNNIN